VLTLHPQLCGGSRCVFVALNLTVATFQDYCVRRFLTRVDPRCVIMITFSPDQWQSTEWQRPSLWAARASRGVLGYDQEERCAEDFFRPECLAVTDPLR
jgi:hypothetical protein